MLLLLPRLLFWRCPARMYWPYLTRSFSITSLTDLLLSLVPLSSCLMRRLCHMRVLPLFLALLWCLRFLSVVHTVLPLLAMTLMRLLRSTLLLCLSRPLSLRNRLRFIPPLSLSVVHTLPSLLALILMRLLRSTRPLLHLHPLSSSCLMSRLRSIPNVLFILGTPVSTMKSCALVVSYPILRCSLARPRILLLLHTFCLWRIPSLSSRAMMILIASPLACPLLAFFLSLHRSRVLRARVSPSVVVVPRPRLLVVLVVSLLWSVVVSPVWVFLLLHTLCPTLSMSMSFLLSLVWSMVVLLLPRLFIPGSWT